MEAKFLDRLLNIWATLQPAQAFRSGLDEYAGRLFVPTKANVMGLRFQIEAAQAEIFGISDEQKGAIATKLLHRLATQLRYSYDVYQEPTPVLDEGREALFFLLMKGGDKATIRQCLMDLQAALSLAYDRFKSKTLPIELRKLIVDKCADLTSLLDELEGEHLGAPVQKACQGARGQLDAYQALFWEDGLDVAVTSEEGLAEIITLFRAREDSSPTLDRSAFYDEILHKMYDLAWTPDEIDALARQQLDTEVRALKGLAHELRTCLPDYYGQAQGVGALYDKLFTRVVVSQAACLSRTKEIIQALSGIVDTTIVPLHPDHQTEVQETPNCLRADIPWAAVYSLNALTADEFRNLLFVTPTNASSWIDLINLVIHEEFGHAVFDSSSVFGQSILRRLAAVELSSPINEAIAVHREYEVCELLDTLTERPFSALSETERAFLQLFGDTPSERQVGILEYRFITVTWRVLRLLRALADVAVNHRRVRLTDFIEWAARHTGLGRLFIWNGYFSFLSKPGYAPSYGLLGVIEMPALQAAARQRGIDRRTFNERLSALGLPATMVLREMKAWIASADIR